MNAQSEHASFWQRLPELAQHKPLVIYGMGDGANKLLRQLNRLNLKPAGIFASDEFVRGQNFAGMQVQTYAEAKQAFGDMVVLICFGTEKAEVLQNIAKIAAEQEVYAPHLPLFGTTLADEAFAEHFSKELTAAAKVWADAESAAVYRSYLQYMWTGRIDYLQQITTSRESAWRMLKLQSDECYLDLGAYDGDTVHDFCHLVNGKWRQIWALEPDAKNYAKLLNALYCVPNCQAMRLAVGQKSELRLFSERAGRSSALCFAETAKSAKATEVLTVSLDDLWQNKLQYAPTIIKMDVEGAEEEVIWGARKLLAEHKPKLALAAYHRTEDIFRLPLLLQRLNPAYKLYLRHHPYIPGWETNIYAV